MLGTLFASTGTIMLTAGDEFGRTQHGNNNAYAQDNADFWIDWSMRDSEMENFTASLASNRAKHIGLFVGFPEPGEWNRLDGSPMQTIDWESLDRSEFIYRCDDYEFRVDRAHRQVSHAIGY